MQRQYRRGSYRRGGYQSARKLSTVTPSPPLGALLSSLATQDLDEDSLRFAEKAKITESQFVTSYNWVDGGTRNPTILVPGRPPRWSPPIATTKLSEDSGMYFRDRNSARFPKHPMQAAAIALLIKDPLIATKIDLLACSSTIGNLLRFVRGEDRTFRILVELVDDMVFLIRHENTPDELIPNVHGYGHSFPEAYTFWEADVKNSTSHQRLIQHMFGGLRMVIRFESDGYLPQSPPLPTAHQVMTVDDLGISLEAGGIVEKPSADTELEIRRGGKPIDQNLVFDLKTRSVRKREQDTLGEELPRMWISQIRNFILAYHTNGVFEDIQVKDVRDKVDDWEQTHVEDLSKLAALVHKIIAEVRARVDKKMEICYQGSGELEFREQRTEAGNALSTDVFAMWSKSMGTARKDAVWQEEDDYTGCTEKCGYCGQCSY